MIAGMSASSITRLVVSRSCSRLILSITNADSARMRSTLPSSDGWKRKNGSSIQRRRAARGGAEQEHEPDRRDHHAVEPELQLAQPRVVEAGHEQHQREPDAAVDRLPQHVVVRAALDVVLGRRPERVDRAGDQPDRRDEQQHVDAHDPGGALLPEPLDRRAERGSAQPPSVRHPTHGRGPVVLGVVERGDDLPHHRGGALGAEAAGLVRRDHDVLRVVRIGDRRVPGLVGAAEPLLRRAGLAGDRDR